MGSPAHFDQGSGPKGTSQPNQKKDRSSSLAHVIESMGHKFQIKKVNQLIKRKANVDEQIMMAKILVNKRSTAAAQNESSNLKKSELDLKA